MTNVPFSSGDSIKHPIRPPTITAFSPLGGLQGKTSCFGRKGDPRTAVRPKHATPRGVAAWPRRRSPSLDYPGKRPPDRNPTLPGFWQRFPYGHGPARVGFGSRFRDPHRFKGLSSLVMTIHAPFPKGGSLHGIGLLMRYACTWHTGSPNTYESPDPASGKYDDTFLTPAVPVTQRVASPACPFSTRGLWFYRPPYREKRDYSDCVDCTYP